MNLPSLSMVDSMRMEQKESWYSTHCAYEGQDREHSKVSLVSGTPQQGGKEQEEKGEKQHDRHEEGSETKIESA